MALAPTDPRLRKAYWSVTTLFTMLGVAYASLLVRYPAIREQLELNERDFAVTIAGADRRASYLDALDREIAMARRHHLSFDTVYFGGGTPSSLPAEQIGRILNGLGDGCPAPRHRPYVHILELRPECEVTRR